VLWLPSLVRSIESEAPGVNVRMVPLTTREPRPMLLRGDIDLAIGFFPGVVAQLAGGPNTPIRHERLYSGQYVCVMRKDHPLASQELSLDRYCAANHLLVSFSGRAHGLVSDALAQLGRQRRILLTVNQFFKGKLARFPDQDYTCSKLVSQRRTDYEAAGLYTYNFVNMLPHIPV
jgi:DNA-binding transcriptional LysR family regulator